ncbi:hypothetical protein B0A48_09402 [Cryoendolithus antarcticus]|uniref:Uncharacterized protein n=1 Tax=Cryoendolithus antarcticus TaxID=1507870 RepID=A0A1V8SZI0_9PEZI|nr:hypothetical protein B0A48_09402 [Cryoendolithus antarcticus]
MGTDNSVRYSAPRQELRAPGPSVRTAENTPALPSRKVFASMLADLIDYDLTRGLPESSAQLRKALESTITALRGEEPSALISLGIICKHCARYVDPAAHWVLVGTHGDITA